MESLVSACPGSIQGTSGALFINLVQTLMAAQCSLSQADKYPSSYSNFLNKDNEFDYIVVGAGAAGSVVASRLSENKNLRVLLIEAGTIPSVSTEIQPIFFTLQNTAEDWSYKSEPSQTACLGEIDQKCSNPRGKVLGGCSSINAAGYQRGNPRDYEEWSKENPGWDYDTVLKYFKKIENVIPEYHRNSGKYGINGLITLNQFISKHPVRNVIIEAAKSLSQNFYPDERPVGYYDELNNIENGVRVSAAKGYLSKIGRRSNLFIAMNAQVGRVLLNGKVATGVEVKIDGKIRKVYAKNEVILSSGAINSPQILLNSGIGPKNHLESLNINLVKDLKGVGKNLQDHLFFTQFTVDVDRSLLYDPDPNTEAFNFLQYRKGIYASVGLSLCGFVSLENTSYPDFLFIHNIAPNINDSSIADLSFYIGMLHPKSKGEVKLKSNDPYEYPSINNNFLSDADGYDLSVFMKGIDYLKKLIRTLAFKKHNAKIQRPDVKNCRNIANDDEFYKCAIRNTASTFSDLVGTCKMGPKTDNFAVVDAKLRVHGIDKLRVVDCSVIPFVPTSSTHGYAMMIGEYGADLIKESLKCK